MNLRIAMLLFWLAALQGLIAEPRTVYTLDATPWNRVDLSENEAATRLWDQMHVLASLQGLANRQEPLFYIFYCSDFGVQTDRFWWDWLRTEDGWLRESKVQNLTSLEEALKTLRHHYQGAVAYDPAVPATSIAAATVAGCENLLPVRYDPSPGSIYNLLTRTCNIPVKRWLVQPDGRSLFTGKGVVPGVDFSSTGSAKLDVHRWALERYLAQCSPGMAAHYIDSFWLRNPRRAGPSMHTLSNHDFFVARKAFFFDLSPWGDEAPNDDPNQAPGQELQVFLEVLHRLYNRAQGGMIQVGGFPPWPYKYTDAAKPPGKHQPVPTEWEFSRIISEFNGYMEADAAGLGAMANASFYQHYPLRETYRQTAPRHKKEEWVRRGWVTSEGKVQSRLYLGHYVGDYDSPSWVYKAIPAFFKDPKRGAVPLGWAFNPNLAVRAPQALAYAYQHATTNDYFIAGDSGAGYLNPRALTVRPTSKLPSGLEAWKRHCIPFYKRWDQDITGFILDGAGGASTEKEFAVYSTFSPAGAGTHFEPGPALKAGIPTCPERDLPDNVQQAAAIIRKTAGERKGPAFFWARSILKSPSWYAELTSILERDHPEAQITTVDPYTFFGLIRAHLDNNSTSLNR